MSVGRYRKSPQSWLRLGHCGGVDAMAVLNFMNPDLRRPSASLLGEIQSQIPHEK